MLEHSGQNDAALTKELSNLDADHVLDDIAGNGAGRNFHRCYNPARLPFRRRVKIELPHSPILMRRGTFQQATAAMLDPCRRHWIDLLQLLSERLRAIGGHEECVIDAVTGRNHALAGLRRKLPETASIKASQVFIHGANGGQVFRRRLSSRPARCPEPVSRPQFLVFAALRFNACKHRLRLHDIVNLQSIESLFLMLDDRERGRERVGR
ncbi:MAG: hypothetical protein KF774_16355 [Planctomyces sp.]|nr:hypothetical protein [Planctomyces sp.]